MVEVFQSYIGEEQRAAISPLARPYDAAHNNSGGAREYELFREIFSRRKEGLDPWGLVSWKFEHKTQVALATFIRYAEEKFEEGFDCVFINPMIANEALFRHVWEQGAHAHRQMGRISEFIARINPDAMGRICGVDSFSFCNYFVGNERFWRTYFEFIDSVTRMLDDEAARSTETGLIWLGDADYLPDRSATMRPFVIERLFSSFVRTHRALRFCPFRHSYRVYERKFGPRFGRTLHALSVLKNRSLQERDLAGLQRWNAMRRQILASPLHAAMAVLDDPPNLLLRREFREMAGEHRAER
ncbi:MAG: hypothetical protein RIS35_2864 [Pseudomonadota bacterium]